MDGISGKSIEDVTKEIGSGCFRTFLIMFLIFIAGSIFGTYKSCTKECKVIDGKKWCEK